MAVLRITVQCNATVISEQLVRMLDIDTDREEGLDNMSSPDENGTRLQSVRQSGTKETVSGSMV